MAVQFRTVTTKLPPGLDGLVPSGVRTAPLVVEEVPVVLPDEEAKAPADPAEVQHATRLRASETDADIRRQRLAPAAETPTPGPRVTTALAPPADAALTAEQIEKLTKLAAKLNITVTGDLRNDPAAIDAMKKRLATPEGKEALKEAGMTIEEMMGMLGIAVAKDNAETKRQAAARQPNIIPPLASSSGTGGSRGGAPTSDSAPWNHSGSGSGSGSSGGEGTIKSGGKPSKVEAGAMGGAGVKVSGDTMQMTTDMIKHFEGMYENAYTCPANVMTIGYGTTTYPDGRPVQAGDTITEADAQSYLKSQIEKYIVPQLEKNVPNWKDMPPNQQAALISFGYNLGPHFMTAENFESIQASVKNWQSNPQAVADALMKYTNGGGGELAGLVRRRSAEAELWLATPAAKPATAPTTTKPVA